jgi:hypothetical protein
VGGEDFAVGFVYKSLGREFAGITDAQLIPLGNCLLYCSKTNQYIVKD